MSRGQEFFGCSQDVFHRNQSDENELCSQENWQGAVICLAQELQLLGYSNICPNEGNFDVISLINCTWSLLQNYRSTLKTISDLEAQSRRLTSDMDTLQTTTSRQRDLLELKDRQSIESDERERKTNLLIHSAQQLLKAEKEETRRLTALLMYRENQYQHEAKRKEMEITKLKERVMKLLVEKSGTNVGGSKMSSSSVCAIPAIEMTTLFSKPDGMARTKWRTETLEQTREDTYYSRIVRDLQDKLNLVSSENIQLRDHFFKLQNDLMKCLRDRETQNGLGDADQDDESDADSSSSSVHLPFNISRENVEKRSTEICRSLIKLFEKVDKKLCQFEVDLKGADSSSTTRESDRELRLKNQLSRANDELEILRAKLKASRDEAEQLSVKKRTILTEDFVLRAVRPIDDSSGAPSWTLSRPNVTPSSPLSRRTGGVESSLGVTVVPVYNYNRAQVTAIRPPDGQQSGRRSLSGNRDNGSGSDVSTSVVKRRSPLPVRYSPPHSGYSSTRESPVRNQQRPRSANLSGTPTPLPKAARHPSRSGSLSPTSTNRHPDTSTRSLPRPSLGRRLTLQRPVSGTRTSDSEDAATSKTTSKPPSTPFRNCTTVRQIGSNQIPTGRRTPSPGWRSSLVSSQAASSASSSSDELSLQLQLLGQFIEQRQLLTSGSGSSGAVDIDDSEMTAHLENVRKALGSQKK